MLYLLRSFGRNCTKLKVGYAADVNYRLGQYRAHNPDFEELGTREGEEVDEVLIHTYLHFLGYCCYGNEWYEDKQEVIDIFSLPFEEIEKKVWENRNNIFNGRMFVIREAKSQKRIIYENLLAKLGKDLVVFSTFSDSGEVIKENCTTIDKTYCLINNPGSYSIPDSDKNTVVKEVIDILNEYVGFPARMKAIYELKLPDNVLEVLFSYFSPEYELFYRTLTYEQAKARSFRKGELGKRYDKSINNQNIDLSTVIYSEFKEGEKYTKSWIKEKLGEIYTNSGYLESPKANDLEKWFELKTCLISNKETGKRDNGFEIIKKKN